VPVTGRRFPPLWSIEDGRREEQSPGSLIVEPLTKNE
jgi:hypothetical protein